MSTYKYKEIHTYNIYIYENIYIYIYWGKMDVEKGRRAYGDREVEEGMVGEGVGWCLRNGGWNGWE